MPAYRLQRGDELVGNSNELAGNSNELAGNSNEPAGHSNEPAGHSNKLAGNSNELAGHSNELAGHSNELTAGGGKELSLVMLQLATWMAEDRMFGQRKTTHSIALRPTMDSFELLRKNSCENGRSWP